MERSPASQPISFISIFSINIEPFKALNAKRDPHVTLSYANTEVAVLRDASLNGSPTTSAAPEPEPLQFPIQPPPPPPPTPSPARSEMDVGAGGNVLPVRQTLASALRKERRSKPHFRSSGSGSSSGTVALIMGFLSCLAWLYVAGRLWQDSQNRILLSSLLEKNLNNIPKVLTTEDKLRTLGCRDIGRRIVEAEMDLTLAKSQGFMRGNASASSGKKLLAVIGVFTGFGSHLKRNVFRGSWMPRGDALKKLEERGVIIRFVIGRSANRGDSLDRSIDEENRKTKDFLILESHEEATEELPKKAKYFFSAAVETWDAEFYVKVDDNINIQLDALIEILESRRGSQGLYMGCMKSGAVITEEGKQWYEPEWWKFGDSKTYFRHASGSLFILSNNLARYININSASLATYAHDDTTVGSWMMGIDATHVDDDRLCCGSSRQEKVCSLA